MAILSFRRSSSYQAAVAQAVNNPQAHQTHSRHSDIQGSLDVITAVPKFTAE